MLPLLDLGSVDRVFFEAISSQIDRLEHVLYDRFAYRTTAGTILGKRELIQYLGGHRIRVRSPVILEIDRITTDRTSVHRGLVRMVVNDESNESTITTGFLHVWVAEDLRWRLGYREARL